MYTAKVMSHAQVLDACVSRCSIPPKTLTEDLIKTMTSTVESTAMRVESTNDYDG